MDSMIRGRNRSTTHPSRIRGGRPMDSMIRGKNSEGKSRFVLVDDDGRLVVADSGGNLDIIAGKDFATESTLETVATEVKTPDRRVDTIIDNATFNATVEGSAISMIGYRHLMITSVLGAKTGTPTYTVSLQVQDSNDNWITYDTLPTLSTGSETQVETYYDIPADTIRVVATLGSTTSFADVTLEVTRMN
jgi:hypothetical protein